MSNIDIENYVDATLYGLGTQSWTTQFPHKHKYVLLFSELTCENPNDRYLKGHLSSTKIGQNQMYSCVEGYRTTFDGWARCTLDGWTPKTLCTGILMGDFYSYMYIFSIVCVIYFIFVIKFSFSTILIAIVTSFPICSYMPPPNGDWLLRRCHFLSMCS